MKATVTLYDVEIPVRFTRWWGDNQGPAGVCKLCSGELELAYPDSDSPVDDTGTFCVHNLAQCLSNLGIGALNDEASV